ncbi:hypothetical protein TorRG33x02_252750 [Trema orientale]|uniref:Uncharacterized protein n=1 Tax=Trema orientale TaxID=63057 RepID=A0A2P5DFT8_TREOI|nr:hypothetical protein TorRG33x02_252750 [Trema orientale]
MWHSVFSSRKTSEIYRKPRYILSMGPNPRYILSMGPDFLCPHTLGTPHEILFLARLPSLKLRINLPAETGCFKILHLIRSWRLKDGENNFSNSTRLERN